MTFDKRLLTDKSLIVPCPTEKQAIQLLTWADAQGATWTGGNSYLQTTY